MTDTRQRLVEATRRCLADAGLAATTSRDITATANANLAAITYYFGSKDKLVATALLQTLREWLSPTLAVLERPGEPGERTLAAIQTLIATFEGHRSDAPVFLEALVHAPRIESLHRGLLVLWDELRSLLVDQMADMQASGSLPGWVEPEVMASLLMAVAHGLVLQVSVDPEGPALTDMAGQFAALLISAKSGP
jgi:AcrR family transcriptional regulator